jgi:predicted nucleic acid-binding protein
MGTGSVTLLDTNYLIRMLVKGSLESEKIISWIQTGEELCSSSVCWYEFLCGPVDEPGIHTVFSILDGRIIPFTSDQAQESARLFNATGRKRRLRVDAMIAAAAILSNATLATDNLEDFSAFEKEGLKVYGRT